MFHQVLYGRPYIPVALSQNCANTFPAYMHLVLTILLSAGDKIHEYLGCTPLVHPVMQEYSIVKRNNHSSSPSHVSVHFLNKLFHRVTYDILLTSLGYCSLPLFLRSGLCSRRCFHFNAERTIPFARNKQY